MKFTADERNKRRNHLWLAHNGSPYEGREEDQAYCYHNAPNYQISLVHSPVVVLQLQLKHIFRNRT